MVKDKVEEFVFHSNEGKCKCFFCQHPEFSDHLTEVIKTLNKVKKGELRDNIWGVVLGVLADQSKMNGRTKITTFDLIHYNLVARAVAIASISEAYKEKLKKQRLVDSVMVS